jgi:hypothetical protein
MVINVGLLTAMNACFPQARIDAYHNAPMATNHNIMHPDLTWPSVSKDHELKGNFSVFVTYTVLKSPWIQ